MTKIDENGHGNKNIDYEMKRQKAIEQENGCKSIRINSDKKDFDINEIFKDVKQSAKKMLINTISKRLSGIEFKWNNIIKSKVMKFAVKNFLPDYK